MIIRAYIDARDGDTASAKRRTMLIPDSAHGTNPASAHLSGFSVKTIRSTAEGLTDLDHLRELCAGGDVAGLMLTNPNTLGLFERNIQEICRIVHDAGGLVYMDGANMNALGSPISGTRDLFLDAEGSVQVNGAETVTNFRSVTGGDFLAGAGPVNASTIDIRSGGNLNFTLSQFAVGRTLGGTVTLNAGGAVNIDARGDQTVFNNAGSVTVTGQTINLLGNNPTQLNFALARVANFTAGTGGFQASTVSFNGASLLNITSGADINVFRISSSAGVIAATSISAVSAT